METWSDQPLEPFKVKFFLDTNILCDLVCNSYQGVNFTISWLDNCAFADLVSSKYVIFEFLDVRKKILYQEEVRRIKELELKSNKKWWHLSQYFRKNKKSIDPNSLVRFKEEYKNREVDFHIYKQTINNKISDDIITLRNLNINYSGNLLHDKLLSPTKELNLFSKLSREDSIVSISSIWADDSTKESFLVLLTRDKPFVDSFNEINLTDVFNSHTLIPPILSHVRDIKLSSGSRVNLTDSNDDAKLSTFLPSKLTELLLTKNQSLFLGKTFPPSGAGFPTDAMCFKLQPNIPLQNNIYLTIIGKNLDFIYSVKSPVTDFFNNSPTPIAAYPFTSATEVNIAFTPKDGATGTLLSLDVTIISRLREEGNLIFINPDGIE